MPLADRFAEPTPLPDPAELDDAYLAETIRFLIDAGTKLVGELLAQQIPAVEKVAPFDRLSRAIRLSILLARHVAENPAPTRAARRAQARRKILRAVEDAIVRSPRPQENVETLRAELRERLDAPDLEDDIANRPIVEIIGEIRRDLGIEDYPGAPSWPRRTPADIADLAECAAAAAQPDTQLDQPDEADDPEPSIRPGSLMASLLRVRPDKITDD